MINLVAGSRGFTFADKEGVVFNWIFFPVVLLKAIVICFRSDLYNSFLWTAESCDFLLFVFNFLDLVF